ncbi:MAG: hypothetical protein R3230_01045 [Nitrosopumilaceae archaeon]|nr:hypothetical protein [Nitrosopumilaceae archaeon]
MYYYEYDKTVDDFPWIVYSPDGIEQISCDDECEAQDYVSMFNSSYK